MSIYMLKTFSLTDIGKNRAMNQDFMFASDEPIGKLPNLYIVADGMGGHKAGGYASKYAVETIVDEIRHSIEEEPVAVLQKAMQAANVAVLQKALEEDSMKGMGTTIVLATFIEEQAIIANVGDSRCYRINTEMNQITKDHSFVEEMVRLGGLSREQAWNHPNKNVITRALGVEMEMEIDFFQENIGKDDMFMLCSDGLTNMIDDCKMKEILQQDRTVEQKAVELVDVANKHGGRDNITVILMKPL
ncbi:MAG: Stp1/IreP family PP2C-type Ser/Thr phosphatase [Eubacteriales bacterium]